jgi:hypothetical protein
MMTNRRTLYIREGLFRAEISKRNRKGVVKPWALQRFNYRRDGKRGLAGIELYRTEADALIVIRRTWLSQFGGSLAVVTEEAEATGKWKDVE